MIRKLLTISLGAIPASILLIPALGLAIGAITDDPSKPLVVLVGVSIGGCAVLGTAGLWRIGIQNNYLNWTNCLLLLAGLVVLGPFLAGGLIMDPGWFIPTRLGKDTFELVAFLGPFFVALFYLAKMRALIARREQSGLDVRDR